MISIGECAAGIVTYNPNIRILETNIFAVSKSLKNIFIYDNGSGNKNEITQLINRISNVLFVKIYFVDGLSNKGIAYGLNAIFKKAKGKEIKWILTLDQDSIIPSNMINCYFTDIHDNVAIISCVYRDRNTELKNYHMKEKASEKKTEYVDEAITSGSFTNIGAWETVGGFDNKLFIDYVDRDFCYSLKKYRYKILRDNRVILSHSLGNIEKKRFLGIWLNIYNHPAWRKKYAIRNMIYVDRKHYGHIIPRDVFHILVMIFKVLFYEKSKKEKIQKIFSGIKEGITMTI